MRHTLRRLADRLGLEFHRHEDAVWVERNGEQIVYARRADRADYTVKVGRRRWFTFIAWRTVPAKDGVLHSHQPGWRK